MRLFHYEPHTPSIHASPADAPERLPHLGRGASVRSLHPGPTPGVPGSQAHAHPRLQCWFPRRACEPRNEARRGRASLLFFARMHLEIAPAIRAGVLDTFRAASWPPPSVCLRVPLARCYLSYRDCGLSIPWQPSWNLKLDSTRVWGVTGSCLHLHQGDAIDVNVARHPPFLALIGAYSVHVRHRPWAQEL
ncbi:hypothetical protein PLICRDRAFT_235080 [Plicaturopsis crispa FD-325 SS-3]|nr:hypothetical protein PLICRDRAFT_235080 [Plicaturopsis crispa FD-325 SS-3]